MTDETGSAAQLQLAINRGSGTSPPLAAALTVDPSELMGPDEQGKAAA